MAECLFYDASDMPKRGGTKEIIKVQKNANNRYLRLDYQYQESKKFTPQELMSYIKATTIKNSSKNSLFFDLVSQADYN